MIGQKSVFWKALLATLIVFNLGVLLGYLIEANRINALNEIALQTELELLDIGLQKDLYKFVDISCNNSALYILKFADKVYEDALLLDRYEEANDFSSSIVDTHKKYDMLRAVLWVNAINLKKSCKTDFLTLVYFYKYNEPSIETKARQKVFSNVLRDIKDELGEAAVLIPIAADNNITSVNILMGAYNVTSYPSVLINEKILITELKAKEEILRIVSRKI